VYYNSFVIFQDNILKTKRKVHFRSDIVYYNEPNDLCDLLKEARISDWSQRQSNKARMERMLNPILTVKHRKMIYDKLYL
jgi:hypothetical protein